MFIFSYQNINAQSPFQGTWKWENSNQTFFVYIMSKTLSDGYKILRIDYKMIESNNGIETEIYSSKFDGQYIWGGAIMSEIGQYASGRIWDRTHPNTTDGYEGILGFEIFNTNPLTLSWKINKLKDNVQAFTTNNPPTDFNLPTDITLTKID